MKKAIIVVLGIVAVGAVAAIPLVAHHAFGGEFDPNRPILLKGAVTKVEWVNPHAWIHLAAKEVTVGRYYMERKDYTGAINRFKIVVTQYQTTRHLEEALLRLTEAYMALGIAAVAVAVMLTPASSPSSPTSMGRDDANR